MVEYISKSIQCRIALRTPKSIALRIPKSISSQKYQLKHYKQIKQVKQSYKSTIILNIIWKIQTDMSFLK
jgi:hypothetical protein